VFLEDLLVIPGVEARPRLRREPVVLFRRGLHAAFARKDIQQHAGHTQRLLSPATFRPMLDELAEFLRQQPIRSLRPLRRLFHKWCRHLSRHCKHRVHKVPQYIGVFGIVHFPDDFGYALRLVLSHAGEVPRLGPRGKTDRAFFIVSDRTRWMSEETLLPEWLKPLRVFEAVKEIAILFGVH